MEESTTAANGVGGRERLTMAVADATEMLGETAGATKSSKARAGATNVAPESRVGRPVVPKEHVALPEMLKGMVGRVVRPSSP